MAAMDWPLFNICLLTLVIHLIGALAYAARIAGVRTSKIALSCAGTTGDTSGLDRSARVTPRQLKKLLSKTVTNR